MLDLELSVIYFSLRDEFFLRNFDILKLGFDPGRMGQTKMAEEQGESAREEKEDDEKSFMWLTACVLFCHSGAE